MTKAEKINNQNSSENTLKGKTLSFLNSQNTNHKKLSSNEYNKNEKSIQKGIQNPTLRQADLDEVEDIVMN